MLKLQVIGNLGKDAIVNPANGRTVINFTVAHTERYKDSTGMVKEKTTWVECAYWTDRTAVAQYLKKGTQVYVEGIPDIRTYTTNDGRNGASLNLRVQSVQLLGGNKNNESTATANTGGYQPQPQNMTTPQGVAVTNPVSSPMQNMDDGDLPF